MTSNALNTAVRLICHARRAPSVAYTTMCGQRWLATGGGILLALLEPAGTSGPARSQPLWCRARERFLASAQLRLAERALGEGNGAVAAAVDAAGIPRGRNDLHAGAAPAVRLPPRA